jgi:hypothetical protein
VFVPPWHTLNYLNDFNDFPLLPLYCDEPIIPIRAQTSACIFD